MKHLEKKWNNVPTHDFQAYFFLPVFLVGTRNVTQSFLYISKEREEYNGLARHCTLFHILMGLYNIIFQKELGRERDLLLAKKNNAEP